MSARLEVIRGRRVRSRGVRAMLTKTRWIMGCVVVAVAACGTSDGAEAPVAADVADVGDGGRGDTEAGADAADAGAGDVGGHGDVAPEDVAIEDVGAEDVVEPDVATPDDGESPDDTTGPENFAVPDDGDRHDDAAPPEDGATRDDGVSPGDAEVPEDAAVLDDGESPDDGGALDDADDPGDVDAAGDAGAPVAVELACNDGLDDDEDGATDCLDANCAQVAPCNAASVCCSADAVCSEPAVVACVCAEDPTCCQGAWDALCAARAATCGGRCPGSASCCAAGALPGCGDAAVQDCVCAKHPSCCEDAWTPSCTLAAAGCGASCPGVVPPEVCSGGVDDDGDGATDCADVGCLAAPECAALPTDCCTPHAGGGCPAQAVSACVCTLDAACCDGSWDLACVAIAIGDCGDSCEPPPEDCTGGVDEDLDGTVDCQDADCAAVFPCTFAAPPCCDAGPFPGCVLPAVEACVCAAQPNCCDDPWSAACVQVAATTCGHPCPGSPPAGTCCEATPGVAGCAADATVATCTCALDSTCCSVGWDDACVALSAAAGCQSCP